MLTYRQFQIVLLMGIMVVTASGAGCARGQKGAASRPDRAAAELVRSLGGERRIDRIRYVRFNYITRLDSGEQTRRNYWFDRKRGLCRIEGLRERTGTPFSAVVNLDTKEGKALVGYRAKATEDPAILNEFVADALRESDWVFGPARMLEPGAQVKSVGVQNIAGQPSPTLDVTLPGPPARHYLAHLSTNGKTLLAWTVLSDGSSTPGAYLVTEWKEIGKFRLPVRYERLAGRGPRVILIENLIAPDNIDNEVFFRP